MNVLRKGRDLYVLINHLKFIFMPFDIHAELVNDQAGNTVPQDLTLHTDDNPATGKPYGRLITKDAYVTFFKNFLRPVSGTPPPPTSIVAFRFNRSILLQMLAFAGCESIVFCKAINSGNETVVAVALNANKRPLGWIDPNNPVSYHPKEFVAAEWIHGLTVTDAYNLIIGIGALADKDDFNAFFDNL